MKYREMVKQVQLESVFSDKESEAALQTFVRLLAERMEEGERLDFASQLPETLENIATAPQEMFKRNREEFIEEIADEQDSD